MIEALFLLFSFLKSGFRNRTELALENLALRQQLAILKREHFNVTEHPTARWTAEQMIQAFPDGTEPKYLLRDRDSIYGEKFRERIQAIGIEEIMTAPRSPWQNPFCERLIGSVRRHVVDFS